MMSITIGVDYGLDSFGDLPTYVVMGEIDGHKHILESGLLEDLCFEKYAASNPHIVGEPMDVVRFKHQFKLI